jgi:hypothetical protein
MSKGHGAIQRKVLDMLFSHSLQHHEHEQDSWLSVFDMAGELTPDDQPYLSTALIESIRRAVKKLEAEGEVEVRTVLVQRSWSRSERGTSKRMLCARLALGDEDIERHRQQARARAELLNDIQQHLR